MPVAEPCNAPIDVVRCARCPPGSYCEPGASFPSPLPGFCKVAEESGAEEEAAAVAEAAAGGGLAFRRCDPPATCPGGPTQPPCLS